jgi:hypothetical protein
LLPNERCKMDAPGTECGLYSIHSELSAKNSAQVEEPLPAVVRPSRSKRGSWFREKGGSSCFAAETYVIVEVQEVEPALNIFARLG